MSDWLIETLRPISGGWSRLCYRMEFEGVENVPEDGPVIFTPNHVTYFDPIWVTVPVKRRIYYMAWDAIFRVPGIRALLRRLGAFPVRLEGHDKSAMVEARCHLSKGHALMIFPEGGRTTTGNLMPFKAGAFRLALFAGATIVPVSIDGAYDTWPTGTYVPRLFGKIRITYHPPIPVPAADDAVDLAELRHRARHLADMAHDVVATAIDPARVPAREPARSV